MFPGAIMGLRASRVAVTADSNRRFQNLGIQTLDRAIMPLQVVVVEQLRSRRLSQDGKEVTSLGLMLA
jgi:hypothetical protein